jgi:hypothetical protein
MNKNSSNQINQINQTNSPISAFLIANKINELYSEVSNSTRINMISADRLVLVGAQSSGKTTLINKIACIDFLPTGTGMVTRSPVHIRLHYSESEYTALLSKSVNSNLVTVYKQVFDDKTTKLDDFKKKIIEQTDMIAYNKYTISSTPLYIDIFSPKVIDFSFIDLPGLIATWLDDQGQQESLIDEIKQLAITHIMQPKTTVLAVMQSDADLQQNIGFALIKEIKTKNPHINVIGVLTKPDSLQSMEKIEEIDKLIGSNMSTALSLKGGYFIVNNICSDETIFFKKLFPINSNVITNKCYGIHNLIDNVSKNMITSIKQSLPTIKNNLLEIYVDGETNLNLLGDELKDSTQRINFITHSIQYVNEQIINSLESNGNFPNTGYKIGIIFEEFLNDMKNLDPFSKENLAHLNDITNGIINSIDDDYLYNIINSFNGYHMTTQASIIKIVQTCLLDQNIDCFKQINKNSNICIKNIVSIVFETIKYHVDIKFASYQKIRKMILDLIDKILIKYSENCNDFIKKYLEIQTNHIWSKDITFENNINNLSIPTISQQLNDNNNIIYKFTYSCDQIRTITSSYFKTILINSQELIIKSIVSEIIKKIEKNINGELNLLLINQDVITSPVLFVEDVQINQKRNIIKYKLTKINEIIKLIDDFNR